MLRLEIWDIRVPNILLDISRRLDACIIHSYLYYSVLIFLFIPLFISIMITDPFCRYSCTYLMLEYLYIMCLFPVLRLSAYMRGIFHVYMYRRLSSRPRCSIFWEAGLTCSGRNFDPHQHHDMYLIASGGSPVNNELDMPASSLWAQRESLGVLPWAHTHPELSTRIRDYQIPFRDHISLGHPSGCWTWVNLFR